MTQGKPERCNAVMCQPLWVKILCNLPQGHTGEHSHTVGDITWMTIKDYREKHSKPSAPQAKSVPSGKDAFEKWYKASGWYPHLMVLDYEQKVHMFVEFAASQTAALRAERDQEQADHDLYVETTNEIVGKQEAEISLLRERLQAKKEG